MKKCKKYCCSSTYKWYLHFLKWCKEKPSDIYVLTLLLEEKTGIDHEIWLEIEENRADYVHCIFCHSEWIDYGEQTCPSCGASFEYDLNYD